MDICSGILTVFLLPVSKYTFKDFDLWKFLFVVLKESQILLNTLNAYSHDYQI